MTDAGTLKVQPSINGFRSLTYALKIWFMKFSVSAIITIARRLYPSAFPLGDIKRIYPPLPSLETRIYLPSDHDPDTKYPLYVSLHGGGYCLEIPDHGFCSALSTKANIAVASVTYRKAPRYVFPTQVEDVAKIINEILADTTLPIDRVHGIIVGGFSAGGHAAMGLAQNPGFKDVIRGVVSMYAQLNHTLSVEQRKAGALRKDVSDPGVMEMLQWAYVPVGHDLRDPILSPVFAKVENLPQKIYFIVPDLDILAGEQMELADRVLTERFLGEVTRDEDERIVRSVGGNQEVVCEVLKGMDHGMFDILQKGWKIQVKDECLERLAEWMKRVFAESH